MSLGTPEDKKQEGITDEITQIDLNMDQAVVLHRALISLSVECKVRRESLKMQKADARDIKTGTSIPAAELDKITEEINLINYTEDKIPYLVDQVKESIIYLQKEDDAIIKGIILKG